MHKPLYSDIDNEIDLRELFSILWAHKLFIAGSCVLGIFFGIQYVLKADKEYSSVATFELDRKTPGAMSFSGGFSQLAALGGLGAQIGVNDLTMDQINGRIFIKKLNTRLDFEADSFFNTFNPNSVEPLWKTSIKSAIGWNNPPVDFDEAVWQRIVSQFSKNVSLDASSSGPVKITVKHKDASRAAEIANVIMDEIINDRENTKKKEIDEKLSYLSSTLAEALSAMELSESKLKEFTLQNSALPLESFTAGSLELDALRAQMNRTSRLHEAVAALLDELQMGNNNQDSYISLRKKFPIVDQVEFRRVLGQNEIISSWSWPEVSSVAAVFDTLTERKVRLKSQIKAAQLEAERYGRALETFAKLEREAKISEASYQVLIEQVKTQSVIAGYQPDTSKVYEYASPSITPSAPKRIRNLALGAILGIFFGAVLALIFSHWRGVYYSKSSLKRTAQARLTASSKDLMRLRNKRLNEVDATLMKKPHSVLRVLAVEINKSGATEVVVTSSRTKLKGLDMAQALAGYMSVDDLKFAVIDFSRQGEKREIKVEDNIIGSFVVDETEGKVSILRSEGEMRQVESISQRNFRDNIQSLSSTFDLVFLCADDDDAISLLSAVEKQKPFHITVARTKHTQSKMLKRMRSLVPIQGLLYD